MVIFARLREKMFLFAMSDPWLAFKNTEHLPKAIHHAQEAIFFEILKKPLLAQRRGVETSLGGRFQRRGAARVAID